MKTAVFLDTLNVNSHVEKITSHLDWNPLFWLHEQQKEKEIAIMGLVWHSGGDHFCSTFFTSKAVLDRDLPLSLPLSLLSASDTWHLRWSPKRTPRFRFHLQKRQDHPSTSIRELIWNNRWDQSNETSLSLVCSRPRFSLYFTEQGERSSPLSNSWNSSMDH